MKRLTIDITDETFEKWKAQDLSQREIFVRGLYFTEKFQNIELPKLVEKIIVLEDAIINVKHRLRQVEVKCQLPITKH